MLRLQERIEHTHSGTDGPNGLSRFYPSLPPSNLCAHSTAATLPSPSNLELPNGNDDFQFLPNDDNDADEDDDDEGGTRVFESNTIQEIRTENFVAESPIRTEARTNLGADNSDSEESFPDFASERSTRSGDSTDKPAELSAREYTVQKLFDQLQIGFHRCTNEDHSG